MGLWVVVNPLVMFIIFVASIVEQIVDPLQYDAYQNVSADTAVCAAVNVAGTALFSGGQLQSLAMGPTQLQSLAMGPTQLQSLAMGPTQLQSLAVGPTQLQ